MVIQDHNQFPVSLDKWEISNVQRKVLFKAHKFEIGAIFGLQEIIE